MVVRVPFLVRRRLPHTMGDTASAWFGRNPSGVWVIQYNTPMKIMLEFLVSPYYTAPSSIVSSAVLFPFPDAPVMSPIPSAMTTAPLASLSLLTDSHSSSVKSRIAATAVLFCSAAFRPRYVSDMSISLLLNLTNCSSVFLSRLVVAYLRCYCHPCRKITH